MNYDIKEFETFFYLFIFFFRQEIKAVKSWKRLDDIFVFFLVLSEMCVGKGEGEEGKAGLCIIYIENIKQAIHRFRRCDCNFPDKPRL